MNKRLQRKLNLFSKDSHCFWCGVDTILIKNSYLLKKVPDNMATLDHLVSRLNPNRTSKVRVERTVLACNKCNYERGKNECRQISIEELRKRSGRYPK